jgi:hypothetical protein
MVVTLPIMDGMRGGVDRRKEELMSSTAFVASCLVISMIAAQNTSRREGVKGAMGLIKGSGNLV